MDYKTRINLVAVIVFPKCPQNANLSLNHLLIYIKIIDLFLSYLRACSVIILENGCNLFNI